MNGVTLHQVVRSVGCAAILVLNDKDRETQWSDYDALPRSGARPSVTHRNQTLPMTYGDLGRFAVPGVTVEMGEATESLGQNTALFILSVARSISDTSPELEMRYANELAVKLRQMVMRDMHCPVYSFHATLDEITGIVGRVLWNPRVLKLPKPSHRGVGTLELGGWYRYEYRFTGLFQFA